MDHFQANYAESAIGVLKRRLKAYVRETKNSNWVEGLPKMTWAVNHSANVSLGDLSPAEVNSALDEPKVRAAQIKMAGKMSEKSRDRYFPKPDSFEDMLHHSEEYDSQQQPFKPGDFCWLDDPKKPFMKATDPKRKSMYIIFEVFKNRRPVRYRLLDLLFNKKVSSYYLKQLRPVPVSARPTSLDFVR